ncbi:MAG: hypothetical protein HC765_01185 [Brachymonas sp.]|nr:hypothetical protein [Brachymonas sp.]
MPPSDGKPWLWEALKTPAFAKFELDPALQLSLSQGNETLTLSADPGPPQLTCVDQNDWPVFTIQVSLPEVKNAQGKALARFIEADASGALVVRAAPE